MIVGAGLAGASVAVTLREEGFRGPIALLGDEATPPFGRPPLSKTYLQGREGLGSWYVKPPDWYDRREVEFRPDAAVAQLDTAAKQIRLGSDEIIRYDRAVLCTGGRPRRPAIPGTDLPGVHLLRTVADCDAIKSAARPGTRAVVVGMGFIGSEVAASLRQLDVAVTAIVSGATPLDTVLGTEVGATMARIHREHSVQLIPRDRAVRFEGSASVERVVTKAGARIECDFAVVGVGIEPNLSAMADTAIALDNGVLVDAQCRTTVDGTYAAGDVANHLHPLFGRVRVEHYNNAEKMGAAAARSILGDDAPYGYVHTFWSDQYEHKLEYVGHAASWDRFVVRGNVQGQKFVGFYVREGILRAAVGLNRGGDPELDKQGELHACQELIARQAAVPIDVLRDERIDLREL
ncbi:MAG: FAD-dependent oxidoreductase [Candidatus Dormibacteraeota bacterium]|uniref:FAD-dependent oxidoreductase n=1 Tax=Candidatus Aeolococcus gillhamiae TaxID=3127015 RepID=A0A934N4T4_9BACT|nr:FAD-dependent oxidoreductase [Candidatus Dormibacteraeota bacterium]